MKPGPDGNRDRGRNLTWLEVNELTKAQRERRQKRSEQRRRNRDRKLFGKVNWEAYQHDQLYDMIMSANPGVMQERSEAWRKLATSIEQTTGTAQRIMQDLLNLWRGSAAVAAAGSNTRLMQWAGDASHTTTKVAAGLADYTEAVVHAQKTMPKPGFADAERNFRNGYTVAGTGGPSTAILLQELLSDRLVSHEQARERKAEAVQVMSVYEQKSKKTHDGLPERYEPINHGANPDQPAVTPRPIGHPLPGPDPTPDSGGGPGSGGSGVAGDVDGDGIADGTTPGGHAGSGTGPGFGTGAGAPGYGGGTVGGVPGGGGASGGAEPVRGGLAASGGAVGAGSGGTRGPAGGFFPPLAGAGQRREDQDREHRIKYDDGMDLFDDLPPAYPPVFGG